MKKLVLKKLPKAFCQQGKGTDGAYYVYMGWRGLTIGKGWTARDAWADAAYFLKQYGA
jgi:hypothetical protein